MSCPYQSPRPRPHIRAKASANLLLVHVAGSQQPPGLLSGRTPPRPSPRLPASRSAPASGSLAAPDPGPGNLVHVALPTPAAGLCPPASTGDLTGPPPHPNARRAQGGGTCQNTSPPRQLACLVYPNPDPGAGPGGQSARTARPAPTVTDRDGPCCFLILRRSVCWPSRAHRNTGAENRGWTRSTSHALEGCSSGTRILCVAQNSAPDVWAHALRLSAPSLISNFTVNGSVYSISPRKRCIRCQITNPVGVH